MGIVLAGDTGARGGGERGDGRGGGAGGGGGGGDRRYAGRGSAAAGRKTPSGSFLRLRGVSPPIVERKLPGPSPPRRTPASASSCLPARWGGRPAVCLSVGPSPPPRGSRPRSRPLCVSQRETGLAPHPTPGAGSGDLGAGEEGSGLRGDWPWGCWEKFQGLPPHPGGITTFSAPLATEALFSLTLRF